MSTRKIGLKFFEPKNSGDKNIELGNYNRLYLVFRYGDLTGNRTPIARMKTWCPLIYELQGGKTRGVFYRFLLCKHLMPYAKDTADMRLHTTA